MDTVIRVTIVCVFVWAAFRVLGKREMTQMSPLELVLLLMIPQLFSRALTRQDYSLTNAIIGASTLLSLVLFSSMLGYRYPWIQRVIQSRPTVLVRNGEFIRQALDQERIAPDDIFSSMRKVGLTRLDQVDWAILESDGRIAIVPRRDDRAELAAVWSGPLPRDDRLTER